MKLFAILKCLNAPGLDPTKLFVNVDPDSTTVQDFVKLAEERFEAAKGLKINISKCFDQEDYQISRMDFVALKVSLSMGQPIISRGPDIFCLKNHNCLIL